MGDGAFLVDDAVAEDKFPAQCQRRIIVTQENLRLLVTALDPSTKPGGSRHSQAPKCHPGHGSVQLADNPLIEDAMKAARFYMNPLSNQPGAWMSPTGIPVDLMVPEEFAGTSKKGGRAAVIPPHDKRATRRARGLEAALVDNAILMVHALDIADERVYEANVAGPAALLVAKLHKLGEREASPNRLVDKDAHDLYRLLRAVPTNKLAASVENLLRDDVSSVVTEEALDYLARMFASGPSALGAVMAGRAEQGIGDPVEVSLSVSLLSGDLLEVIRAD